MKKNGFTLVELVLAMIIISVLTGTAFTVFKTYDKGIKHLYSNTYYVLDRALYNSMTYWVANDSEKRDPFITKYYDTTGKKDVTVNAKEGTKRLCRALVEYINPVEGSDRDIVCRTDKKFKNKDYKSVDDSGADSIFKAEDVQFTATNGIRFWISKRYPDDTSGASSDDMKFFIIYADLNGIKKPNSMFYEAGSQNNQWKTKDPDIFAFAALENGRICPLGIPEVEPRYLTTRIVYQEEGPANNIIYKYSYPSKTYVASKAEAWGYYMPEAVVNANNATVVPDNSIIDDEPLTYNGYIREKIRSTSKIYNFLPANKTMGEYVQNDNLNKDANGQFNLEFKSAAPSHIDDNMNKMNTGGYNCQWMSSEECSVIVDKYVD